MSEGGGDGRVGSVGRFGGGAGSFEDSFNSSRFRFCLASRAARRWGGSWGPVTAGLAAGVSAFSFVSFEFASSGFFCRWGGSVGPIMIVVLSAVATDFKVTL